MRFLIRALRLTVGSAVGGTDEGGTGESVVASSEDVDGGIVGSDVKADAGTVADEEDPERRGDVGVFARRPALLDTGIC